MAISVKHAFTSAKADGTDSTLVQPSNWNAEHTITLGAGKVLGRSSASAGAMQELPIAIDTTGQSMIPPTGTTAERPATAIAGMFRYNSTSSSFEGYTGSAWGSIGGSGGATGGTGNAVFYQNDQTVTVSYAIPAGQNAGTFGPVTVNSGITVTVPTGSTWSIV